MTISNSSLADSILQIGIDPFDSDMGKFGARGCDIVLES